MECKMSGTITPTLYAEPRHVADAGECRFYHRMELPGLGITPGDWDLRGRADDYLGQVELAGKRVLDVGTASGFLTFEMERRGADVVSFDAASAGLIQMMPFMNHAAWRDRANFLTDLEADLVKRKNAYWLAHRVLGSRASACYGNVYDLPAALGEFDAVVVGQILVHLRDPIGALQSITDRCRDTLVIAEAIDPSQTPMQVFLGRAATGNPAPTWWHLSLGLYQEILAMMGFGIDRMASAMYTCVAANQDIAITTLVCRRLTTNKN
jgi:2-polyprenyl-3-methyl-5-hydroxy-6-metoxy-1,4-benzoquinol methylase